MESFFVLFFVLTEPARRLSEPTPRTRTGAAASCWKWEIDTTTKTVGLLLLNLRFYQLTGAHSHRHVIPNPHWFHDTSGEFVAVADGQFHSAIAFIRFNFSPNVWSLVK